MFGNNKFKINLGDIVKDKITGFKGVVIARAEWLYNCNTYTVKPQTLKDGTTQDTVGFDEPALEVIGSINEKPKRDTGGPERKLHQTNR